MTAPAIDTPRHSLRSRAAFWVALLALPVMTACTATPDGDAVAVQAADSAKRQALVGRLGRDGGGGTLQVETEGYGSRTLRLDPSVLVLAAEGLDPRFEVRLEEAAFEPEEIQVTGPLGALEALGLQEVIR